MPSLIYMYLKNLLNNSNDLPSLSLLANVGMHRLPKNTFHSLKRSTV